MGTTSSVRDSDDDAETGLYIRIPPMVSPWPSSRRIVPLKVRKVVPRPSQNVFFLPPKPTDPPPPWAIRRRAKKVAARRTMMPWVVFAMCFGITFGIARDARVRAELASDLRATPARILAALHSLAS